MAIDIFDQGPFGFGPFPLPGETVGLAQPHPPTGGYGGVGLLPQGGGGAPYGPGSYGSRWFGRPRLNVQGGYGGDPYGLGGYGGVERIAPFVSAAISISGTEVEVYFSEDLDPQNPALTDPVSYALAPVTGAAPASVLSVHIERLGSVNLFAGDTTAGVLSVVLTHTGTTLGGTYRVTASGLTDLSGNDLVPMVISFLARGTPPSCVASLPDPDTGDTLVVIYDRPMLEAVDEPGPGPGIGDAGSYRLASQVAYPIQPQVLAADHHAVARKVYLTVQGMTSLEYALTVGPAFAFSYDPVRGLQEATRVDTGTGTAVVSGTNLVLGRLAASAFGLEWQDLSGTIVPLSSTLRMDCRYDLSNAVYTPALSLFPSPQVIEVLMQDGPPGNGILVRFTLQCDAGGVEQIRLRSGSFDQTVEATWSGGPHTVSLVRNQKAGTVAFLLDDYPLMATALGNVDGVPETQAGIRFSLLVGAWSVAGVRLQEVRCSSSQTVYSQAWNFLHDGETLVEGSSVLTRDTLLTQRGPLVKGWGDATPATKQDVTVLVNQVAVEVAEVNPYIGAIRVTTPIPRLPASSLDVQVDYKWFKSPIMELSGLNTPGLVLNKFDCPRRGHHLDTVTPDLGAVDTSRFPMSVVLGPMTRPKPLFLGHRYMGFEREYSALTNSPTTLLLNQAPGRVAVPGFDRTIQGVSVAYEGLVQPQVSSPAWSLLGTDFGGVDHSGATGLDIGTYTVIDALTGPYDPARLSAVVYRRGVDISFPSSVDLVARFQVAEGALFDAGHPASSGVAATTTSLDGVFTGVGFGIHDNRYLYFCGVLQVNDVQHVGLLLDPKRLQEVTAWILGPRATLTASSQTVGRVPTAQVPTGFVAGSRFQVLSGLQAGVYTATSVVRQTNGTTTVVFTPALPTPWDRQGGKYPEVVFETRTTAKPFTYRFAIDTDQQVAELRVSGEMQGVVASIDGNVPALPPPSQTALLLPMGGTGQVFWGSPDRQATSRATWSFLRYGVVPDQVFIQGHVVAVSTEMGVVPEDDTSAVWYPEQSFGSATVAHGELVLKTGVSSPTLDFIYGYSRVEPFFIPDALFDLRGSFQVDSGVLGAGDVELHLDDTQRVAKVMTLLYLEGFAGDTTYRRLIQMPAASMTGFMLPETLGWTTQMGNTIIPEVEGTQLVTRQTSDTKGGWAKDLDWNVTTPPSTDEGRLFEARLAVKAFNANASGDTGVRFGCQMPVGGPVAVVQVELRAGFVPGVRLRTATGASVAEYDFDWTAGDSHTYRVLADRNAATVSLVVDDVVQLPVASLGAFGGGVNAQQTFFGCYGVAGDNTPDPLLTCTVEWYHFHCHVLPPAAAKRTFGVWKGGDTTSIDNFEIPRVDTSTAANSWRYGPEIQEMDWRSPVELRVYHDPGWGVTVFRPDLPPPPYYQPEDGHAGHGFITESTEPSAGWINVEYPELPRSSGNLLGVVGFGSFNRESLSQSRWDWVRYRMTRQPTEDLIAPEHMVLNQGNVIASGELTQDTQVEQVELTTLSKTELTLLPTHLYAKSVYKVVDGSTIRTPEQWSFDPLTQVLTLQQDLLTGEVWEFSSENAHVTVSFIPGHPVTNTYLLNQPLLDGVTLLNEGTPPVPMSQVATAEIVVTGGPDSILQYRDVEGSLYEDLDFFQVTDGGQTGLIASICEGGPGTGFSGLFPTEGEDVYSPEGTGDPLGGTGHVAGHFTTGVKVGKAVGAEVLDLSGTMLWQDANFPASPDWTQKGGSPGGVLFASGGSFTNPVVDGHGHIIPGALVAAGGTLGPGTAVLYPSFPSRGPVGGDQGRIYKRTDWTIRWGPGRDLQETWSLAGADSVPPGQHVGWEPNPGGTPHPLGAARMQMQFAGDYSRVGPWGGLLNLTPGKDQGSFRVVSPVDGDVVRVWDTIPSAWVTFTARVVPIVSTDFALAPAPHTALAAVINAYPFTMGITAAAGLTLGGQMMVQISSATPVDIILNPLYLQAPNPTGFTLADVVRLPGDVGLLQGGAGIMQSSLVAGGSQNGAITEVPSLLCGMVAQGGSPLPQSPQINLTLFSA